MAAKKKKNLAPVAAMDMNTKGMGRKVLEGAMGTGAIAAGAKAAKMLRNRGIRPDDIGRSAPEYIGEVKNAMNVKKMKKMKKME